MDILDSLKLVNTEYGSMVRAVFELIEMLSVKPSISKDSIMVEDNSREVRNFGIRRGVITQQLESGFILRNAPLAVMMYFLLSGLEVLMQWWCCDKGKVAQFFRRVVTGF